MTSPPWPPSPGSLPPAPGEGGTRQESVSAEDAEAELRRREKLASLGKLSAGLAHELNNPAAAARRAAGSLREAVARLEALALGRERPFSEAERRLAAVLESELEAARCHGPAEPLDPLAESDREEALAEWLDGRGVEGAWELAPTLACAGLTRERLETVEGLEDAGALAGVVQWLEATIEVRGLIDELEGSTARIADLAGAIKEYASMDRAPQEVDLHEGLESTLKLLHHKLKMGIAVRRDYDRGLPRVQARAGELNQVWTNLIDNAIDAMDGRGRLTVRTRRDGAAAVVEIVDDGPGIPPEIRERVFDAFFTTKEVGKGTGLGLDIVRRIVEARHKGEIAVESRPGETRFTVRLPIAGAG